MFLKETVNFVYIYFKITQKCAGKALFDPFRLALWPVVCGSKKLYIVSDFNLFDRKVH